MKRRVPIQCPICDVNLHPTDPFSDIRFDQTLQDLTYMIDLGYKKFKTEHFYVTCWIFQSCNSKSVAYISA